MNIIQAIRRGVYGSMSDDQLNTEYECQKRLYEAIGDLHDAIKFVNRYSECWYVSEKAFNDFLHDEMPKISSWDEKIAEARHG